MKEKILNFLESDSRLSKQDLAARLGCDEKEAGDALRELEADQVICGYPTLINWDKTDKQLVTALIEVRVTPQRGMGFDKIAERIYNFEEVKAVYLMSGGFDLTVILEGKTMKEVSYFVSDKLAPMEYVLSTATHFVMKKYKDHGVILEKKNAPDERMIFTP